MANNNTSATSNMPQPTLADLFAIMEKCAQRDDILDVKSSIQNYTMATNEKIKQVTDKVETVSAISHQHADKIVSLEATVELLKQDQLKNNICISGVPPSALDNTDTADIVIKIAHTLEVELNKSQFNSYAIANKKFIIAQFHNIKHKQLLLSKIRAKRSLMVEEIINAVSNGQIYLNDHLTPHFSKLFVAARKAHKDGLLASVSSAGGKIRVRKTKDFQQTIITSEAQLHTHINMDCDDNTSISTINTEAPGTSNSINRTNTLNTNRPSRSSSSNRSTRGKNRKSDDKDTDKKQTLKRRMSELPNAHSKKPNNNNNN